MKVYIVNGYPGSGKTTFEKYVYTHASDECVCYMISSIDFVKKIAKQCGWDGTKDAKNRKFLSDLKSLLTDWNDVPFERVVNEVESIRRSLEAFEMDKNAVVFIDCREPVEIDKFKYWFKHKNEWNGGYEVVSTVFINRTPDKELLSNSSDLNVNDYTYDIVIQNNASIEKFKEACKNFMIEQNISIG